MTGYSGSVRGLQPATTACSNKLWELKAMSLFVEDQKMAMLAA
jgi:hypothetical protein